MGSKEAEISAMKRHLVRINGELEGVKWQEKMLIANFRLQKSELESKLNELINVFNRQQISN